MITTFKIYEVTDTSNKYPFSWYVGKWYIHYSPNYKYNWEKKIGFLGLINAVDINKDSFAKHKPYSIKGESIDLFKNGEVEPNSALAYNYTIDDFNALNFLTTEELFLKHNNIFITLYHKCVEDMKLDGWASWYINRVKLIFSLLKIALKTHPDVYNDYLAELEAGKYNL